MASYRVFQFSDPLPGDIRRGDDIRVLRDGFSAFALILPIIYLLWHRLWAGLAIFLLIGALTYGLSDTINPSIGFLLDGLLGLYLGFEGNNWRAAKLAHHGWREIDVVLATNQEEAEARALEAHYRGEEPSTPKKDEKLEPVTLHTYHPPVLPRKTRGHKVIGTYTPKPKRPGYPS